MIFIKYFTILLVVFLVFSCDVVTNKEDKIETQNININVDKINNIKLFHIYFQNINNRNSSSGINKFDQTNDLNVTLNPGTYNIYLYGLIDKTSTTIKVCSYGIYKNIECYNNKFCNLKLNSKILEPDIKIIKFDESYIVKINMKEIYEIFSISSFSIKQGTDRVRSIDLAFDENSLEYYANVPFYQHGQWLVNISYSLKTKYDDKLLENDNISLSTSNFTNIVLGEY